MNIYELIISRRSIRKFKQKKIPLKTLKKFVNAGRLAPSASNLQPLEFIIINDKNLLPLVFENLFWARYLGEKGKPRKGEEPTAYIICLVNFSVRKEGYEYDVGACCENIILSALGEGIGSCWLRSIKREELSRLLNVPENYFLDSVIALGYPAEKPVVEEYKDSHQYYRDEKGRLHVPKRRIEDLIHINKY